MLIYKTLFEVQIFHDYFLDNGIQKFDSMTSAEKQIQLGRYNISDFLEIFPTPETQKLLVNQRMRLILQNDGFKVVTSTKPGLPTTPVIPIADDVEMTFGIRIRDTYFNNYTDLKLAINRIYLFSNTEPEDDFPLIPVITETPDPDIIDDTYLASAELTKDFLETFPLEARVGLLGLFTLRMKTGDTKYDITTDTGLIKYPSEAFRIHFVNMKRFWKYKKSDGTSFRTAEEQPLVKYGFITLESTDYVPETTPVADQHFPNAGVLSFEKGTVDGDEVIYSVIFI